MMQTMSRLFTERSLTNLIHRCHSNNLYPQLDFLGKNIIHLQRKVELYKCFVGAEVTSLCTVCTNCCLVNSLNHNQWQMIPGLELLWGEMIWHLNVFQKNVSMLKWWRPWVSRAGVNNVAVLTSSHINTINHFHCPWYTYVTCHLIVCGSKTLKLSRWRESTNSKCHFTLWTQCLHCLSPAFHVPGPQR